MEKSEAYPWQLLLSGRLSKFDVESYAQTLHHDEQGISLLVETLLTTKVERVALNAAWILSHLRKEDKEIYLASSYDKLADFAMQPHLTIRRGLVLSILLDISIGEKIRTDLLDFCLKGMLSRKESDSSRSMMIKLASKLCKPYPELKSESIINLELLSGETKPSIACARKNALNYLKS